MGRYKIVFPKDIVTGYTEACKNNGGFYVHMDEFNSGYDVIKITCPCGLETTRTRNQVLASVKYFISTGKPIRFFCSPECKGENWGYVYYKPAPDKSDKSDKSGGIEASKSVLKKFSKKASKKSNIPVCRCCNNKLPAPPEIRPLAEKFCSLECYLKDKYPASYKEKLPIAQIKNRGVVVNKIIKCPHCKKSVIRKHTSKDIFCSHDCYIQYRFNRDKENITPTYKPKNVCPPIEGVDHTSYNSGKGGVPAVCKCCGTHTTVARSKINRFLATHGHKEPLPPWTCSTQCYNDLKLKEAFKEYEEFVSHHDYRKSLKDGSPCPYKCQKCKSFHKVTARQIRRKIQWAGYYGDSGGRKGLAFVCPKCSKRPKVKTSKRPGKKTKDKMKKYKESVGACACGVSAPWALVVHHIDGNSKNNDESNWEVLCCNCHAARHLTKKDGRWARDTKSLTPREHIPSWK